MGFRFRKSFKIAPGLKLNVSKSGFSTTIGGRGASVNIGKKGAYLNTSIPGTVYPVEVRWGVVARRRSAVRLVRRLSQLPRSPLVPVGLVLASPLPRSGCIPPSQLC
ncbi:DUF4236 domain-containing protein [Hymenobacter sp. HDW8]|uniref:DUF4236 domain-containing protein n=1 Tax=Hymenobacter sp. HDW8 TaxID=2714932 RepID=UPI001409FC16|nr:DUF4236 domain-containing protein [Hymenobacter sp. HDW8]QIL78135.1 DUF4236 domain-containing protein [Hymenobacter sp. HDW8]